jgi:membrane protease YdiL (CAAX protease family)
MTVSTFLVAIVTEEGFFRGWLWGSLEKAGIKTVRVLIWSSIAFAFWHISAVTLDPDFKPPAAQIPVYLCNAAVVGAVWGLLRAQSGSIIVTSLSHGLWNGMAYVLFGFGSRQGSLGIRNTAVFGPENGLLGLGLNLLFACLLWRLLQKRGEI